MWQLGINQITRNINYILKSFVDLLEFFMKWDDLRDWYHFYNLSSTPLWVFFT